MKTYYEGELYEVSDTKELWEWEASPDSGCGKAGRKHKMLRDNCYLTYCIYEDCDHEI